MIKYAKSNFNKILLAVFFNILLTSLIIYFFCIQLKDIYISLIISVSFSLIINLILIIFSNEILIKLNDAKQLSIAYSNGIKNIVEDLSKKYGIKTPTILFINEKSINSISIGLSSSKSYIALTKGALDNLNEDELKYMLSYEMLKISKREVSLNTILVSTVGLIIVLSDLFFRSIYRSIQKRGQESESLMRLLLTALFFFLSPIMMWFIHLYIPKNYDLLNDNLYLDIENRPLIMISTLNKIKEKNKINVMYSRACTNMFFVNPLRGQKVSKKFSYHNSIARRIKNIKSA